MDKRHAGHVTFERGFMMLQIERLNDQQVFEIVNWRYEPPYHFYDMDGS